MSRLDGVRLKLDRGREHYEEIVSLIKVFAQTNPFDVVAEIDGQNGGKIWLVDGQPSAPPLRMSVLVGDCLINYRAALDHLAWQLVLVNGEEPTKRTMFPISDDADRYRTSGIPRLRGISSAAVEKIESYEPCFGANEWRNRNLTGLETFVNIDKHRHLHVVTSATSGGLWNQPPPIGTNTFIHAGPVGDGTVLARVPGEHAYVEFGAMIDVAFDEPSSIPQDPSVHMTLHDIGCIVDSLVDEFESEFF